MTPRNQAILLLVGGVLFFTLGIWWLGLPGMQRGGQVFLVGSAVFLIGGIVKFQRLGRR